MHGLTDEQIDALAVVLEMLEDIATDDSYTIHHHRAARNARYYLVTLESDIT
jgi:hypothetical protein